MKEWRGYAVASPRGGVVDIVAASEAKAVNRFLQAIDGPRPWATWAEQGWRLMSVRIAPEVAEATTIGDASAA